MTAWTRDVGLICWIAFTELRHRRSLRVVGVLTVLFLALFGWGTFRILGDLQESVADGAFVQVESTKRGAGFLMLGIAVFVAFSLSAFLAIFTTMNAVKGEAEQGLLQALLVRPVARSAVVTGRVLAATLTGGAYAAIVVGAASLLTTWAGGTPPGNLLAVVAGLTAAVAIVAALSVLLSTFLGSSATGMAATMLVSVGFFASLVRQIARETGSQSVETWAGRVTDLLGFNALYEGALGSLTEGVGGLLGFALQLGPFGEQRDLDAGLWAASLIELAVLIALATWRLRRLDL